MNGPAASHPMMPAAGQLWPPPVSDHAAAELELALPSGVDEDNEILLGAVFVRPTRDAASDAA